MMAEKIRISNREQRKASAGDVNKSAFHVALRPGPPGCERQGMSR
jgi:hypothetical protein